MICDRRNSLRRVARKSVSEVSIQIRHKPDCKVIEKGLRLEISD